MKSIQKRLFRLTVMFFFITIVVGIAALAQKYRHQVRNDLFRALSQEPSNTITVLPIEIDGAGLIERYQSAQQYQSTPEEITEDNAYTAEQISQAGEWLSDVDAEQRLMGAEQLGAYPSTESEKLLVEALNKDRDEQVRIASAVSLSYMHTLSHASQKALIDALQDDSEELRSAAFSTLQALVNRGESVKQILNLLKKQMKSKKTPIETREAIKDYLLDQFPRAI